MSPSSPMLCPTNLTYFNFPKLKVLSPELSVSPMLCLSSLSLHYGQESRLSLIVLVSHGSHSYAWEELFNIFFNEVDSLEQRVHFFSILALLKFHYLLCPWRVGCLEVPRLHQIDASSTPPFVPNKNLSMMNLLNTHCKILNWEPVL